MNLGQLMLDAARGNEIVRAVSKEQVHEIQRAYMERARPELERLAAQKRRSWQRMRNIVLD